MLLLRSLAFNTLYYANLIVCMIVALPTLAMPRAVFRDVAKVWARSSLWLLRVVAGTRVSWRGLENIPPGGLLVASKHQSLWETFALLTILDDPAYVLKRELMWIPFFGWYAWKARSVPVNRKGRSAALADLAIKAEQAIASGRQVILFPEGTRRAPGAEPAYKWGIVHLYDRLNVPVLPIALNSGVYWPRRKFLRRPGTIVVEVLPPIPPGKPKDEFFAVLQETIETASNRLLAEGRGELVREGTPQPADERPGG
ncbi:lysophospholipid acyltransferase family protein [Salinarimonas sp. NSM]|uniref:lysophospholipid acyltransferase family protein n=1 Tax=Salinarimonas sp. NSM TaxID=3458003 RepID=UPI0040374C61